MSRITFYEKPGCANNSRQKAWLRAAGHQLEVRNLLSHPWTEQELLAFFGDRPVEQWWNRAAPRIKSKELDPSAHDAQSAIALMRNDPLLIRRPLIEADGRREIGFDIALVHAWLGLPHSVVEQRRDDAERCVQTDPCAVPRAQQ